MDHSRSLTCYANGSFTSLNWHKNWSEILYVAKDGKGGDWWAMQALTTKFPDLSSGLVNMLPKVSNCKMN